MSPFFPHTTVEWKIEEPPAFRRFSMVIWEMALVTGVLFRLYRALAMTAGPADNWLYFGGAFVLGLLFVLGMATLHLGNFPLKHWLWRAPAFGALEAAAESLTSLALIFAHREPIGSERAHPHEWVEIAAGTAPAPRRAVRRPDRGARGHSGWPLRGCGPRPGGRARARH